MKRELKVGAAGIAMLETWIAKLIPMKRELKAPQDGISTARISHRKADPDEKGTESISSTIIRITGLKNRKADPDEKGTERLDSDS